MANLAPSMQMQYDKQMQLDKKSNQHFTKFINDLVLVNKHNDKKGSVLTSYKILFNVTWLKCTE